MFFALAQILAHHFLTTKHTKYTKNEPGFVCFVHFEVLSPCPAYLNFQPSTTFLCKSLPANRVLCVNVKRQMKQTT